MNVKPGIRNVERSDKGTDSEKQEEAVEKPDGVDGRMGDGADKD